MPWYACLLATMIVTGAMPTQALFGDDSSEPLGPACKRADDDQGFGGSHVTCRYSCSASALLAIGVKASDKHAFAYGNTECADASAACAEGAPVCFGTSDALTTYAQEEAKCHGHSDEAYDSPVLVACLATTPADPKRAMCDYANICPEIASASGGPNTSAPSNLEQVLEACVADDLLAATFGDLLLGLPAGTIEALSMAQFSAAGSLQVALDASGCIVSNT